jgi:hypothetical protein
VENLVNTAARVVILWIVVPIVMLVLREGIKNWKIPNLLFVLSVQQVFIKSMKDQLAATIAPKDNTKTSLQVPNVKFVDQESTLQILWYPLAPTARLVPIKLWL